MNEWIKCKSDDWLCFDANKAIETSAKELNDIIMINSVSKMGWIFDLIYSFYSNSNIYKIWSPSLSFNTILIIFYWIIMNFQNKRLRRHDPT